jgi:hypothetical protein
VSDNRKVASTLMAKANHTITKARPGLHGSAELSFQMIADLWTVYIRHTTIARDGDSRITAVDVSQMMSLLKKARSIYGDVTNDDNFVDDLGYSALAGMLQLPDPDKMPKPEEDVTANGHEHVFPDNPLPDQIDAEGFVGCLVDNCTAKKQVTKKATRKAEAAS